MHPFAMTFRLAFRDIATRCASMEVSGRRRYRVTRQYLAEQHFSAFAAEVRRQ